MQSLYRVAVLHAALAAATLPAFLAQAAEVSPRPLHQQEYWARIEQRDFAAAIDVAQKLVDKTREQSPSDPLALAEALTLLGGAQLRNEDNLGAEATFVEALGILERHVSSTSDRLIEPLEGLAYAYAETGRHEQAVPLLDRAVLITRRTYGLFDKGQRDMLNQLARSLTALGLVNQAERHMAYLLQISEHRYGKRDPRVVPTMCEIASWYADIGNFARAREMYRSAIDLAERMAGRNDPRVAEPLRGLASTYLKELQRSLLRLKPFAPEHILTNADGSRDPPKPMNPRMLSDKGEEALARAVKILTSQPEPDEAAVVPALIELGDWFQVKHDPEKALHFYKRAAELKTQSVVAEESADAQRLLTFPVRVYYPSPELATRYLTLSPDQVTETFVEVEFTVTAAGAVTDARVLEHNGTDRQVSETLEAIRAARFRPKFVGIEPVDTPGMKMREVFRTRKESDAATESSS
ncbi:MAG TPA: TonB family protein [Steroidobacteraceae bacterium]